MQLKIFFILQTCVIHIMIKILSFAFFEKLDTFSWTDPYTSFGTHLCLPFHIVVFDTKTLVVPWHQFVYTLFISCGRMVVQPASVRSSSFVKRLPAWCAPSLLGIGKYPTVPGPDCTEDARRCPNGIGHAARLVSAGQYEDVHCRATE